MKIHSSSKLPREFYTREVLEVAPELLGKYLVKENGEKTFKGKIVEVEAYDGRIDQAAHTFTGRTPRNEIMFGEGGYFYVYFTYGAHYCCNIVTGKSGEGTAVLIRAVEPVEGIEKMVWNRYKKRSAAGNKELYNLTSGPGKVCQAFGIDKRDYGLDLTGDVVYLLDNRHIPGEKIAATQRIGVTRSAELLWRFYIKDNPFISKR